MSRIPVDDGYEPPDEGDPLDWLDDQDEDDDEDLQNFLRELP